MSFRQGGLTFSQLQVLYDHYQDRRYKEMRFTASMQGVDLDKELAKKKEIDMTTFKDPRDYDHLSVKDRRKLTQKMIGRLRHKLGSKL